jgi:hypothetical protein
VSDPTGGPFAEAERLMRDAQRAAEAAAAAAGSAEVPPRGWDVPHGDRGAAAAFPDLSALVGLVESLRGAVPPELLQQLTDALRELLIALRAILDYSIARLDPPAVRAVEVEDIPIE